MRQNFKQEFIDIVKDSFNNNSFVKLSLSAYFGEEENLKNIYLKPILIKKEKKINFVYRYKSKDITKNHSLEQSIDILEKIIVDEFKIANLFTLNSDYLLELRGKNKLMLKSFEASIKILPSLNHDKAKNRNLSLGLHKKYLNLLGITDKTGKVSAKSQNKFKQINHYIEILSPKLKNFEKNKVLKIADMGSGKGYLTFALYDYLINELKVNCEITGIEFRSDLVEKSNKIANQSGFENLKFIQGEINKIEIQELDILIALHACDTATDDAIVKGIKANADLIVLAPCCQHQIRQEMEKSKVKNILSPILKHGIFLERQAELLTDGIRNLILQYFGYSTKTIEFIADAHTHKNIMIIAEKNEKSINKELILQEIHEIKTTFGIKYHYLEKLLEILAI